MCGIAGCVLPKGSAPDESLLRLMGGALAHRGPDDTGVEVVGQVGLVHRRLAVVDPSPAGHQPMRDARGRWWLTYNGEIFNHRDLRRELDGVDWRSTTDTETLLCGLGAWGRAVVPRCNGFFAYAALDTARGELLLVRDRFGVKPLYLARHGGALWFASEMGALLAAGVPRKADPAALAEALSTGWVNGAATPLQGVESVAPGAVVTINLDDLSLSRSYWYRPADVVDPERMGRAARRGRAGLRAELEAALRESVRLRLMADVPLGTMCSGGVDSSLVARFAADEQPGIYAYNVRIADQPDADESRWAEKVAKALRLELRTVNVTAETWRQDLVRVVRHIEYPLRHESSVPMSQIAGLARADGVKVLLSGEGADELFGGYEGRHQPSYAAFVPRSQLWRDRSRTSAAMVAALWHRRGRGVLDTLSAMAGRHPSDTLSRTPLGLNGHPPPAPPESNARAAYAHHEGARAELEAAMLEDIHTFLPHLLNRQDKSTMLHSVETRVPFLDPEVVSFALNLPLETRVTPRRKGILRELARQHLPRGIAERFKFGFGFDVRRYLSDAADPSFLEDGCLRELFRVPREQWRHAVAGLLRPHVLRFWTGEIWCRLLLEGQPVAAVESALWGARAVKRKGAEAVGVGA
ncbi:MAG TPA: asparagine synthase (glutamine-hydrolyzing) [Pyrinomonadaceae bacterium]|nr:asparagine synthase (glutamine-hydrolyzing) [Pyrinomonadaceae bacterium]